MNEIKILIVEDEEVQRQGYIDKIDMYNESLSPIMKFHTPIEEKSNITEALNSIRTEEYDAVIIDLKLNDRGDGNEIIKEINDTKRVPIYVVTGTPGDLESKLKVTGVYKRTDDFNSIIQDIVLITKTGLSKIMGGRGKIEEALKQVYWNNLIGKLTPWKEHVKQGIFTENYLLRYTLNHLIEILDQDEEHYVPEEMYICPPISKYLKTGSIVNHKNNGKKYITISPACDLSWYNGSMKSDYIQFCEIEENAFDIAQALCDIKVDKDTDEQTKKQNKRQRDIAKNLIKKSPNNTHTDYYHFLPKNEFLGRSLINFRIVLTISSENLQDQIDDPFMQVAPVFVKDIVARFSSYYARQGQPVLHSQS